MLSLNESIGEIDKDVGRAFDSLELSLFPSFQVDSLGVTGEDVCMKEMRLMNKVNGRFLLSLNITDLIVTTSMINLPSRTACPPQDLH
jgi:hypothetical protein